MYGDEPERLPRWANRFVLPVLSLTAAGFAVFATTVLIDAIQNGSMESPSRYGNHTASRETNPAEFWMYVGLWSFAICIGISCAIAAAVATYKEFWSKTGGR